jgi:hypothetical protein
MARRWPALGDPFPRASRRAGAAGGEVIERWLACDDPRARRSLAMPIAALAAAVAHGVASAALEPDGEHRRDQVQAQALAMAGDGPGRSSTTTLAAQGSITQASRGL